MWPGSGVGEGYAGEQRGREASGWRRGRGALRMLDAVTAGSCVDVVLLHRSETAGFKVP